MDFSKYSNEQIINLIKNYRRQIINRSKIFIDNPENIKTTLIEIEAEHERRTAKGLSFEKSMSVIEDAARQERFLSYKDLADASGANWQSVHYEVGSHLWRLVSHSHARGWPMLSAIVVNKPNVATGKMEPEALKGFVNAARVLGIAVLDEEGFLKEQQKAVFAWAKNR